MEQQLKEKDALVEQFQDRIRQIAEENIVLKTEDLGKQDVLKRMNGLAAENKSLMQRVKEQDEILMRCERDIKFYQKLCQELEKNPEIEKVARMLVGKEREVWHHISIIYPSFIYRLSIVYLSFCPFLTHSLSLSACVRVSYDDADDNA
jgi:hypothetical protein